MRSLLLACTLALAFAADGGVQAKDKPVLMALAPDAVDPLKLVPPPPAAGSAAEKAEIAELHDIQAHRTAARMAQAQWDDAHEDWSLFGATLGPKFDLKAMPATAKLLAIVQNDQEIVASEAKAAFKRPRPWAVDASIAGCPYKAGANPLTSYPSGHTVVGFSLGVVLADLAPHRAQALLSRASDYGYSRLICGLHYRSDLVASQTLGTAIAIEILRDAKLQPLVKEARAEFKAAGLDQ